jgi:hypothetical protein
MFHATTISTYISGAIEAAATCECTASIGVAADISDPWNEWQGFSGKTYMKSSQLHQLLADEGGD